MLTLQRGLASYISLVLLLLTSQPATCRHKLAMWIDGSEIEQFVGEPFDIYVITEGEVMPYLQDAYYDNMLPILPPEVRLVELNWMADGLYLYKFSDLRSLDPSTLYNPLLSIPKFGIIPKQQTAFQMTIPCTGQKTSIASMYIVLHIHNSRGEPIPGSPIKLHLRKRCIAFQSKHVCHDGCKNGGTCNDMGRCDCPKGYYGDSCHLAVCFPGCLNNGTCVKPGQCECPEGYIGDSCETVVCRLPCQNGGYCISPYLCDCPPGFYGDQCQHREGFCEPPCINGGTCSINDTCMCLQGYMGQFCQKPFCKQSCGVNGYCVDVNECECYRGWRGRFCHKTAKHVGKNKDKDHRNRKGKRRRKLRHGRKSRRLRRGKQSQMERRATEKKKTKTPRPLV